MIKEEQVNQIIKLSLERINPELQLSEEEKQIYTLGFIAGMIKAIEIILYYLNRKK